MAEELIGIIGGTGLGDALQEHLTGAKVREVDTPFGRASCPVVVGTMAGRAVAFLNRHGRGHKLSPSDVPFAANIFALKKLGATAVIASGAVGSLREGIHPRELVIVDQVIDKTFRRQGTFFAGFGAVHCEMAEPFCGRLRKILADSAKGLGVTTHEKGVYVCMEGPQFSTRAESLMHRGWGGQLIGMTAMPEARLAREAQMCYALVALVSDYDCWRAHEEKKNKQTLLQEIVANLQAATNNAVELIKAVLQSDSELCSDDCPCRRSLELAVWTDPAQVGPTEKQKLKVLFD